MDNHNPTHNSSKVTQDTQTSISAARFPSDFSLEALRAAPTLRAAMPQASTRNFYGKATEQRNQTSPPEPTSEGPQGNRAARQGQARPPYWFAGQNQKPGRPSRPVLSAGEGLANFPLDDLDPTSRAECPTALGAGRGGGGGLRAAGPRSQARPGGQRPVSTRPPGSWSTPTGRPPPRCGGPRWYSGRRCCRPSGT